MTVGTGKSVAVLLARFLWISACVAGTVAAESPGWQHQMENAQGLVHNDFAFCQALPLSSLSSLEAELCRRQYHAAWLRPYRSNDGVFVAGIWRKNASPSRWLADLSCDDIGRHNETLVHQGFELHAIAGYRDAAGDRYLALWTKAVPVRHVSFYAGLEAARHDTTWRGLCDKGFYPVTLTLLSSHAETGYCGVWCQDEADSPAWRFAWGSTAYIQKEVAQWEPRYYRATTDFCYKGSPAAANYAAIWYSRTDVEDQVVTGPASIQLRRGRELAEVGYRPVSIALDHSDGNRDADGVAVWHRPMPPSRMKALAHTAADTGTAAEIPFIEQLRDASLRRAEYPAARDISRDLLAWKTRLFGAGHWKVVDARLDLADVDLQAKQTPQQRAQLEEAEHWASQVRQLYHAKASAEALPLAQKVVAVRRTVLGEEHRAYALAVGWLALVLEQANLMEQAEQAYRDGLARRRRLFGNLHPETVTSADNLADLYINRSDYAQAEPLLREVVDLQRKICGENTAEYARSVHNLANLYRLQGDIARAEPFYRQAVELRRRILGESHADTAASRMCLITVLWRKAAQQDAHQEFAAACTTLSDLLKLTAEHFGTNAWMTISIRGRLAHCQRMSQLPTQQQKEIAESERLLAHAMELVGEKKWAEAAFVTQRCVATREEILGNSDPDYVFALLYLALSQQGNSEYGKAESNYQKAIEAYKKIVGDSHPDFAAALTGLARLYDARGDYGRAQTLYRQAAEIRSKTASDAQAAAAENVADFVVSLTKNAVTHATSEDFAAAHQSLAAALSRSIQQYGETDWHTINAREDLADADRMARLLPGQRIAVAESGELLKATLARLRENKMQEAISLADRCLSLRRTLLGQGNRKYAEALSYLALAYDKAGDFSRADPLHQEELECSRKILGENHPNYARTLYVVANSYAGRRDYARSERLYRQAMETYKKVLGEKDQEYLDSLAALANLLLKVAESKQSAGDAPAGREAYTQALELSAARYGREDWRTTDVRNAIVHLDHLARLSDRQRNELDSADRLFQQASELCDQKKYREAIPLAEQCVAIRRRLLGEDDRDYAKAVLLLPLACMGAGEHGKFATLNRHAAETAKRVLGENHPEYAINLTLQGALHWSSLDYARTEPLFRQALEINRKAWGECSSQVASSLDILAGLYRTCGNLVSAEPLCRKALEIRRNTLGELHPDYAASLMSLGELYCATGDVMRAEPSLSRAVEIYKQAFGENHLRYASSLWSLANVCHEMGNDARAEVLYRQSLEIQARAFADGHLDYNACVVYRNELSLHARRYIEREEYALAEPLLRQTLAVYEKLPGQESPGYAATLATLATMYRAQGNTAQAELLQRQALQRVATKSSDAGNHDPGHAVDLLALAVCYAEQGDEARAEPLFRQSAAILASELGEDHPAYLSVLKSLAATCQRRGDYPRAGRLLQQATTSARRQLEQAAAIQSERQQLAMLAFARGALDQYLGLVTASQGDITPAYREVLAWKGAVLRRQRQIRKAAADPKLAPAFADLQRVTAELAHWSRAVPDAPRAGNYRETVVRLSEEKDRLEAALSSQSEEYRRAHQQVTLEDLQAAIPADTVLVDCIEFNRDESVALPQRAGLGARMEAVHDGVRVAEVLPGGAAAQDGRLSVGDVIVAIAGSDGRWNPTAGRPLPDVVDMLAGKADTQVTLRMQRPPEKGRHEYTLTRKPLPGQKNYDRRQRRTLLAFVVRRDHPVEMVVLGDVLPISAAIDTWRQSYGMSSDGLAAGRFLRARIWQPLEGKLQGAKTVLVSPDGALAKLPLAALPGKESGAYLIEELAIASIPVPQLIPEIVAGNEVSRAGKNLLVVGNVDYDVGAGNAPGRTSFELPHPRAAPGGFAPFAALAGTAKEVLAIEQQYREHFPKEGITVLQAAHADKSAVEAQAPRHRFVHVATHGFFAPGSQPSATSRGHVGTGQLPGDEDLQGLHPGLLSGLVFAGANAFRRGPTPLDPDADDGILTAEEIGSMNLEDVELVVLSACETGLGQIAGGEGLLGLQRAFQSAGARSVVASLWKVPDDETQALIAIFYANLWQKQLSPLESLRAAQLAMLHGAALDAPSRLRTPDFTKTEALPLGSPAKNAVVASPARRSPQYWAAFVLSGDWRLAGHRPQISGQPRE